MSISCTANVCCHFKGTQIPLSLKHDIEKAVRFRRCSTLWSLQKARFRRRSTLAPLQRFRCCRDNTPQLPAGVLASTRRRTCLLCAHLVLRDELSVRSPGCAAVSHMYALELSILKLMIMTCLQGAVETHPHDYSISKHPFFKQLFLLCKSQIPAPGSLDIKHIVLRVTYPPTCAPTSIITPAAY